MNSALLTLLIASAVALCALLSVASGLIHTSLKRRKAVAAGGPDMPSRILDDLRPVKALLVDFVRHSPEMTDLLAILSPLHSPASFAHLVHEIRIGRNGSTDPTIAANLVGPTLLILGLAGLVRITAGGFVITEVGREVQRRNTDARQPEAGSTRAALVEPEERADLQPLAAAPSERLSRLQLNNEINTMNINNRKIIMTAADHAELDAVIRFTGKVSDRRRAELAALENELKRAEIVASEEIPPDVITMNSRAELLDLESKERMQFTLVLPHDADIEEGKISVLAALGTAMIGYRNGDTFEWPVPYGRRRLKVTAVHFQPEASLKKAA